VDSRVSGAIALMSFIAQVVAALEKGWRSPESLVFLFAGTVFAVLWLSRFLFADYLLLSHRTIIDFDAAGGARIERVVEILPLRTGMKGYEEKLSQDGPTVIEEVLLNGVPCPALLTNQTRSDVKVWQHFRAPLPILRKATRIVRSHAVQSYCAANEWHEVHYPAVSFLANVELRFEASRAPDRVLLSRSRGHATIDAGELPLTRASDGRLIASWTRKLPATMDEFRFEWTWLPVLTGQNALQFSVALGPKVPNGRPHGTP